MGTRFYFPDSYAATLTPSSWSAGWNKTTGTVADGHLTTSKSSGFQAIGAFTNTASGTSGHFTALRRYISGPLVAQTISGTIKGQVRCIEIAAGDNYTLAVAIKAIQSDGSDRGVLLAVSASDNTAATPPEFSTSSNTNRQFLDASENASIALTSTAISAGDRLVVEIGFRQASTSVNNGQLTFGTDHDAADHGENNTETGLLNPWIEFSGVISLVDYAGSSSAPADGASTTNTADPTAVIPPTDMLAGDLVVMVGQQRATGVTLAVSQAGGQTWNTLTAIGATNQTVRVFWCQFNGTWSANPSVDFSATTCNSVQMHVFRPSSTTDTWSVNQAQVELDFSGTTTPTITGQTTTGTDPTITLVGWFTPDDNTWGSISGTGWQDDPNKQQFRNTSGSDQSAAYAWKIQGAAAATGNVTKTQLTLGDDPGTSFIITFAAASSGPTAHAGNATFNGAGSESASATQNMRAAETLPGTSALSINAISVQQAAATFGGAGSLSADTQKYKLAVATFDGASSLSANSQKYKLAEAAFAGVGNLSADESLCQVAAATFVGAGSLSVDETLRQAATAIFEGVGSFSTDATVVGGQVAHQGAATFNGAGNFSALVQTVKFAAATFAGAGNLSGAATVVSGAVVHSGEATFAGAGTFSARITSAILAANVQLVGNGVLAADTVYRQAYQGEAVLVGSGSLSADVLHFRAQQAEVVLAGDSDLSVSTIATQNIAAVLGGEGGMQVHLASSSDQLPIIPVPVPGSGVQPRPAPTPAMGRNVCGTPPAVARERTPIRAAIRRSNTPATARGSSSPAVKRRVA